MGFFLFALNEKVHYVQRLGMQNKMNKIKPKHKWKAAFLEFKTQENNTKIALQI